MNNSTQLKCSRRAVKLPAFHMDDGRGGGSDGRGIAVILSLGKIQYSKFNIQYSNISLNDVLNYSYFPNDLGHL